MAGQLPKTIGLWSATSLVIGSIIGAGIFMRPATMAGQLGSPTLMLAVWVIGGVISLFGAMIYAELGAMYPETGGPYVYLQEMYGDLPAFLYGWSSLVVINTASLASFAFVCADYTGWFVHLPRFSEATEHLVKWHIPFLADIYPLENFGTKTLAILILLLLTIINYRSLRGGNGLQVVATVLKALVLILVIGGILFSGKGHPANFITNAPGFQVQPWLIFTAVMAATSGAFSTYDGWYNINMMAGEVINPQRNISRSLFIGLGACIGIYLLANLAYLYVLPVSVMAHSTLVAADAVNSVLGNSGAALAAGLIVISCFGAAQNNFIANARVTFLMGQTGDFFAWTGRVQPKYGTPGNAMIIMGLWSMLFILSGSFDIMADMFVFMSWVFYGLTAVGLFLLRRKRPGLPRPYSVGGYPWLPALFILFTLFYLATTIYNDITAYIAGRTPIINSVFGLVLTAAGIPFYWYFQRQKRKA
ncbi:MAG TPA: amino acid permease [Puia sp.]|nr:amino acid permease [Puia sp.]